MNNKYELEMEITSMVTAALNTSRKSIKHLQKEPETSFYVISVFCLMYWVLVLKKYRGGKLTSCDFIHRV